MFHESLSWLCKKLSPPVKKNKIIKLRNFLVTGKLNWAQKIKKDEVRNRLVSNIEKSAKNYLVWKFGMRLTTTFSMMRPVSETARPLRRFIRITTMRNTNTSRKEKDNQASQNRKLIKIFKLIYLKFIKKIT
jgi:hypothetical protein